MAKLLMVVRPAQLRQLHTQYAETGMDFQFIETSSGFVATMNDGTSLPCYDDPTFYCLADLLAGIPIPTSYDLVQHNILQVYSSRSTALAALRAAAISSSYTGTSGAFPLIGSDTLGADTIFYRCLSSSTDHRFVAGKLAAGTYLTTSRDRTYANTGFATVGRFALPLPLPASHVAEYEIRKGTLINVGTVAPAFGQAGGGVEVQLPSPMMVRHVGTARVDDY